jgi:hypothetical protein
MVSIVLVDRNCVIHEVFLISSCTAEGIASVEVCARQYNLTVVAREVTVVQNMGEVCDAIFDITNSITGEFETYPSSGEIEVDSTRDPVVEIDHTHCLSTVTFDRGSEGILELDWDE